MTRRETLGLRSVHIDQLMTSPALYTIQFTLQLYYKPLGILQRVTKSQKFHISNHDILENVHNINFVRYRSQGFPEREQSSRNFPLPQSSFLRTIVYCSSNNRSNILQLPPIHLINICKEI